MEALSRARQPRPTATLVYDTPGFARYFRESTPLSEIATLNIGSRPSSRRGSERIEDLRAIPWVFSWAQCRLLLPGWYGFGSAVEAWLADGTRGPAHAAATWRATGRSSARCCPTWTWCSPSRTWPIASRYAELVPDEALRESIVFAHRGRVAPHT